MNLSKKKSDIIRAKLIETGASTELRIDFDNEDKLVQRLRNSRLRSFDDIPNDLKEVYSAMEKAMCELTVENNNVKLTSLTKKFEELVKVPAMYPKARAASSIIVSQILRSLGFTNVKRGAHNSNFICIDLRLLNELTEKLAAGEPVGAVITHKEVEDWLRQHDAL